MCISTKFPGDADAAGLGTILRTTDVELCESYILCKKVAGSHREVLNRGERKTARSKRGNRHPAGEQGQLRQ